MKSTHNCPEDRERTTRKRKLIITTILMLPVRLPFTILIIVFAVFSFIFSELNIVSELAIRFLEKHAP